MSALTIQDGDSVIFDENGERKSIIKIKTQGSVRVGKVRVPMSTFIGAPFGAVFTLSADGQQAQRVEECPVGEWAQGAAIAVERNNAGLFDRNTDNQKLSSEDITAMKEAGKGGQEIIEALISNSATFQAKTEFSQEKYKRKKAKKYLMMLTLRRPTGRWISETYYEKGPERVYNLRPDSLAIMLSLANVSAGAQVLVIDGCVGVVAACVVERLGGMGAAVVAHVDNPTPLDPAKALNLTTQQLACIHVAPVRTLLNIKAQQDAQKTASDAQAMDTTDNNNPTTTTTTTSNGRPSSSTVDLTATTADASDPQSEAQTTQTAGVPSMAPAETTTGQASTKTCQGGASSTRTVSLSGFAPPSSTSTQSPLESLVKGGFACCLIANPKYDPTSLLQQIWPLLAPSAAFVVFSCWPQPLAECLTHLQVTKQAVLLQLQESWMRPYQVLPSRTHPNMMCAGTGGYILSGIKVLPDGVAPAPVVGSVQGTGTDTSTAAPGATEGPSGRGRGIRGNGGKNKRGRR